MSFNTFKNIADLLRYFPIHYQEVDFIQEVPLVFNDFFRQRLGLILREGVVFNSEYDICENIISPILIEVWQSYKEQLLGVHLSFVSCFVCPHPPAPSPRAGEGESKSLSQKGRGI
jgi:hypothetical protein